MSGCYGNDAEDRYFENKLISMDDDDYEKCEDCDMEYQSCECEDE